MSFFKMSSENQAREKGIWLLQHCETDLLGVINALNYCLKGSGAITNDG